MESKQIHVVEDDSAVAKNIKNRLEYFGIFGLIKNSFFLMTARIDIQFRFYSKKYHHFLLL